MREDQDILIDEVSASVTYVGRATRRTATSAALWQIMKITEAGTLTSVKWADGSNRYEKVWDDRATYTY